MMDHLLERLKARGVTLYLQDGKLRFKGPKGALTPPLREQLAQHRDALIRRLEPAAYDGKPFPLSGPQRRIWVLSQMDEEGSLYNVPLGFHLTGPLNGDALQAAFTHLIGCHETLRTGLTLEDGEPRQQVHEQVAFQLQREDLRGAEGGGLRLEALEEWEEREPFDLEKPPLLRAVLAQLEDEEHRLLITLHHIISDGWSISVLMRDLIAAYRHHCGLEAAPPQASPTQYRHYVCDSWRWQDDGSRDRAYWLEKLAGPLPVLDLPTDRPRPALQTHNGAEYLFDFKGEQAQGFHQLARSAGASPFITFTALLKVLLMRHTGERDIIVGAPMGGRLHPDLEDVVGCFLNTLALRDVLHPEATFAQVLEKVRRTAVEAYDHGAAPFEEVVGELALDRDRDLSRSPLFDVMVISQTDRHLNAQLGALQLTPRIKPAGVSKFDMTFHLTQSPDSVGVAVEYNSDLFDQARVEDLALSFITLLDSILAYPNLPVGDHAIMPASQQRRLLLQGPQASWSGKTLLELFQQQADRNPDRVAVAMAESPQQRTYGQLFLDAQKVAGQLAAMGVGPGVLVGVCVDRSLHVCAGLLGVLMTGAAYVPMDPDYPRHRLAHMLEHSQAPVVLVQEHTRHALPAGSHATADLDALIEHPGPQAPIHPPRANQPAYVIYTSGSTGKPKGVMIPHGALTNFLLSMAQEPGLTEVDRLLAVTSFSFDISGLELFLPLAVGARVVLASRETVVDGNRLAAAIGSREITVMQATPVTWRLLLQTRDPALGRLKVLCGGEGLPRDLARELRARASEVWNLYGPTETTIWSARHRVETEEQHPTAPIGGPLHQTGLYVLDHRLRPVPPGTPGLLYIGGDGLAFGYHRAPTLTAQRFVPNPFSQSPERMYHTGDLVRMEEDAQGRFRLLFLGRDDGQIKLRGHRIELGEIESALTQFPNIRQAVALLCGKGDNLRLAVWLEADGQESTVQKLREDLGQHLPEYMIPSRWLFTSEWPYTPNGKVDRGALAARAAEEPDQTRCFQPPQTPTQKLVARVWAQVLDQERIGLEDGFFEMGGHSLTAARVVHQLTQAQAAPVALVDLFRHPTVAGLAQLLDSRKPSQWNSEPDLGQAALELREDPGAPPELTALDLESLI